MPMLLDEILIKYVNQAYDAACLRRNRVQMPPDFTYAGLLVELEANGYLMRLVDASGRIAWSATPRLRNCLTDLQLDAEADLEDI